MQRGHLKAVQGRAFVYRRAVSKSQYVRRNRIQPRIQSRSVMLDSLMLSYIIFILWGGDWVFARRRIRTGTP